MHKTTLVFSFLSVYGVAASGAAISKEESAASKEAVASARPGGRKPDLRIQIPDRRSVLGQQPPPPPVGRHGKKYVGVLTPILEGVVNKLFGAGKLDSPKGS